MFNGKYVDRNQKLLKAILDFYGSGFLHSKKILDLGAGFGDIGGALFRLGAEVTLVDIRQEHIKVAQKKFNGLKTVIADLDQDWQFKGNKVDLVLDIGIICHLQDFKKHIQDISLSADHLILETAVCDSLDPDANIQVNENRNIYDLAYNGKGSRPSTSAIERELTNAGFVYKRITTAKYNSKDFNYTWNEKDDNSIDITKRRLWFCVKKHIAPTMFQFNATKEPASLPHVFTEKKPIIQEVKKSKIAVCISGHLRTFRESFPTIKNYILDKYECDVFISTWDTLGMPYRGGDAQVHNKRTEDYRKEIMDLIHPLVLEIEPKKHFEIGGIYKKRSVDFRDLDGIQSMFYKIQKCNDLKKEYEYKNMMTYSAVIRIRADLILEAPLYVPDIVEKNCVYVPRYGDFTGLNDQFAFGSSSSMDIYSSVSSRLVHYLQSGAIMNPEKLTKFNLDVNKVNTKRFDYPYYIKRSNGHIQRNYDLEKWLRMI